jgi:hypothetical protein
LHAQSSAASLPAGEAANCGQALAVSRAPAQKVSAAHAAHACDSSAKPAAHVQSCGAPDGAWGCWHAHASMDSAAAGDVAPAKHCSHAVALGWSAYVPGAHASTVLPTA